MDLRCSSVILLYQGQGIGGWIIREVPMCLPDLTARTNMSSGVRLIEYVTPQGPAKAVLVAAPTQSHGPSGPFRMAGEHLGHVGLGNPVWADVVGRVAVVS